MDSIFTLDQKVIVVTGGTGVLGSAFADGIARAGGTAVVLGRNRDSAKAKSDAIIAAGGKADFVVADVMQSEDLMQARAALLERYGQIHGLVNAAGGNVPEGVLQSGEDVFGLNIEGMRKAMELNIWGTVLPNQIFGPALAASGTGSIVQISSVSSKRALTRVLGYSMGKSALDIYTKWMAVEIANRYGESLRINSISPGFFLSHQNKMLLINPDGTWTERAEKILRHTPLKRFGKPEDLEGALVWLLSDASRFVTGMDIGVDGGFTIFSGV